MIYRLNKKNVDEKFLSSGKLVIENRSSREESPNYNNVIVKKPWGYEYLVFENNFVAIWLLQIIRKRKTSMHCHPKKKTGLLLLSGLAAHHNLEGTLELNPQDGIIFENSVFHCTEAHSALPMVPHSEDGIWVMEIESPPAKEDLVRIKDEYGRTGASYEGASDMVFEPKECLKFSLPEKNKVFEKGFLNYQFSIRRKNFGGEKDMPDPDSIVSVIGKDDDVESLNPYLKIGELVQFRDFYESTKKEDLSKYHILIIEKTKTLIKLSDYVFSFIADLGVKYVFAVCGGAAMHLVDSAGNNKNLKYIAMHHEQATAMAAEAASRLLGIGAVLVTSGPGGTNTLTGLCGAWVDSIPVIFVSGQVTTDTLIKNTGLRQFGIQESDIVNLVKPVTKYAVTVEDPELIKYHLQKAAYLALNQRPGPVWIDIPLDIQSKLIDTAQLVSFDTENVRQKGVSLSRQVKRSIQLLKEAKRPVIISGYGIRLAKAEKLFLQLVEKLKIPVISSWTSSDLVDTDHEFYIGRSGIMGDRAGNFTVQNSDLLLILGSRMSIPQVGYNYAHFARAAKKIMVDMDEKELSKPSLKLDLPINSDAKEFILEMLRQLHVGKLELKIDEWLNKCRYWKNRYPVNLPEYKTIKGTVNSFYFVDVLSSKLSDNAVVVTDMGTSFTCTMQAFKTKKGQRLFTSSGHASMGFGLPGAIGACFGNNKKKVICITGDGGLQMNIQELQTVVYHKLPIIIFVLNNNGYLTIKLMQQNHFGRYVGSDRDSGLSCPDIVKVANAYGIETGKISNHDELHDKIDGILSKHGPFLCEIIMSESQQLIPRVSSLKKPDGSIVSRPLEDMYPFLSREEYLSNMLVKDVEILND